MVCGPNDPTGIINGRSLARAGDLNADGMMDLLVGAPGDPSHDVALAVYLLTGSIQGELTPADAQVSIISQDSQSEFGRALAAEGDVNGDGHDDILVGAPGVQHEGDDLGVVYLFQGPFQGDLSPDILSTDDALASLLPASGWTRSAAAWRWWAM